MISTKATNSFFISSSLWSYKVKISKKDLIFFSLSKLDYNQALNFISKESQSEGFIIASKIPYENSIIMSCDKYFCKLYVDNYTIYK